MNNFQRLDVMGIPLFQIRNPDIFAGHHHQITLPESCKLLLISESLPQNEEALLFSKIIATMGLKADQTLHLMPQSLHLLNHHQLQWCWFCGCEGESLPNVKMLHSSSLAVLQQDQQAKKYLWQQIKTHQAS